MSQKKYRQLDFGFPLEFPYFLVDRFGLAHDHFGFPREFIYFRTEQSRFPHTVNSTFEENPRLRIRFWAEAMSPKKYRQRDFGFLREFPYFRVDRFGFPREFLYFRVDHFGFFGLGADP